MRAAILATNQIVCGCFGMIKTAEGAEGAEEEKREMNNSDTNGFVIIYLQPSGKI